MEPTTRPPSTPSTAWSGSRSGSSFRSSSGASSGPARRSPDTLIWWNLANVIDVVHFPIVVALVLLGAVYFSGPVFVFLLTLMVVLQIATLGCPVMWLTGQLRRVHDPDYEVRWSFTAWLYARYGRWVGIGVFCALGGLTLALRAWLL